MVGKTDFTSVSDGKRQKNSPAFGRATLSTLRQLPDFLADVLFQSFLDDLACYVAYNLLLYLAAFEDQQGRNAPHSVTLGSDRAAINVHFGDFDLA
jgi:hypothetical protein